MNQQQRQALAELQASNNRDLVDNWTEAANDPTNTSADTAYALRQVAAANHRLQRGQ
jgi:hypothetical protein